MDLIKQRGLQYMDMRLIQDVQSAVDDFCGRPSPYGGKPAKRNNSRPISDAVDWDTLSKN